MNFEDKMEDFCRWKCKYTYTEKNNGIEIQVVNWILCSECEHEEYQDMEYEIVPCEYCQIKEFIRYLD